MCAVAMPHTDSHSEHDTHSHRNRNGHGDSNADGYSDANTFGYCNAVPKISPSAETSANPTASADSSVGNRILRSFRIPRTQLRRYLA
jgi:hypothetical protein